MRRLGTPYEYGAQTRGRLTMDNKQRQSMSDAKAEPLLWYVYIRELEVGTFY